MNGAVETSVLLLGEPATYLPLLVAQGVLGLVLFCLVGVAYLRRRTKPYQLRWIATSTLLVDGIVGTVRYITAFDPMVQILLDHSLDILLVVLVLGAIRYARRVERPEESTANHS